MEKMNATFYVLTILGALLMPLLAQELNTTANITTNGDLNKSNANNTHSEAVSQGPKANDVNLTSSESTVISSTQMAAEEGTRKPSNVSTTLKTTKGVTSPAVERITTKVTPSSSGGNGNNNITVKSTTTKKTTSDHSKKTNNGAVYVFVLVILILIVVIFGIIYFCVKRQRKRFTADITGKHEDAQIPLASVEPEICDSSSKGADLKTFMKTNSEESPPTDTTEKTEEQKALSEADQEVKESPDKSEAPDEKPSEPLVDDADPAASTQTSVETLNDVLNENNSNNNAVHDVSVCFIDICLND
ncbi:hypothetical protein KOW79_002140 [Hemibagrus wyckioides]|uniref:Uncharacterized protein n=1 Tax=Hemibagrus wyckioides TaxID=337641 RepID=A0A9D3P6D6_9TELE|nr:uncharacterized protein si:dkey-27h10.2 [Hemibagrus wyckioides]KAG7333733.1 hypothetical protein KOW79_002140 [Hemibagrus wyckioides]